jgi:hypothetical protein
MVATASTAAPAVTPDGTSVSQVMAETQPWAAQTCSAAAAMVGAPGATEMVEMVATALMVTVVAQVAMVDFCKETGAQVVTAEIR